MDRKVDTRGVLRSLNDQVPAVGCYLSNEAKQLYLLDLLYVEPETWCVELKSPTGRLAPIDPGQRWFLTVCNHDGAYRAKVRKVLDRDDSLIFFLDPEAYFLARRKSIRLCTDSRNPIGIHFFAAGEAVEGLLLDFSLHGLGALVDPAIVFVSGMEVTRGSFQLRNQAVHFRKATVMHTETTPSGLRLGLAFRDLTPAEQRDIKHAFDHWFRSQPYASGAVLTEG